MQGAVSIYGETQSVFYVQRNGEQLFPGMNFPGDILNTHR